MRVVRPDTTPAQAPTPAVPGLPLLAAMRPRQWVKNALCFCAPAAAGELHHGHTAVLATTGALCFCAISSATYLVNDASDVEADRLHPTKRYRPMASGAMSISAGLLAAVVLAVAAVALAAIVLPAGFLVVLGIYAAINAAYSAGLKRVAYLELVAVASGFILRAAAGGVATSVPLSKWFLVVVSGSALFLVIGKRLSELSRLGEGGRSHRASLEHYQERTLTILAACCGLAVVVAYGWWSFTRIHPEGVAHPVYPLLEFTTVPVALGMGHLFVKMRAGEVGSPEELVFHDRVLQVLALSFLGLFVVGLYG